MLFWRWISIMNRERLSASKEISILFINEIKTFIADKLSSSGMDYDKVESISTEMIDDLRKGFGGMTLYFPKNLPDYVSERQSKIYDDYERGVPVTKLAAKFNLSMSRIYDLLNMEKKARLRESN